ncbi:MAG: SDR family NAD(P)-dependent oxidoreductase [Chloroflexota bacterium]|nr:SDR family NAD(P)-dependent oxidoreductase [Chloroflexota bacterium]
MTDRRRFEGRTCLVTGSTGMAGATAHALAAEGAAVFVVSRTAKNAQGLAMSITGDGGRASCHAADLTDEDAVEAAVAACVETLGRLDAVFNVAGISGRRFGDGPLHEMTLEGWETVITANATSLFLVSRAAVRQMLGQERDGAGLRGTILNMSSVLARRPSPRFFATHAYAASKGAIEAFSLAAAASYAPSGIRINVIAPALVATPMSQRAQEDPATRAYLAEKQPLTAGVIDADDVTGTALYLLSDDSRAVTGQVVAVDGGWSLSEPRDVSRG